LFAQDVVLDGSITLVSSLGRVGNELWNITLYRFVFSQYYGNKFLVRLFFCVLVFGINWWEPFDMGWLFLYFFEKNLVIKFF
jgi:hypothetical protein